MAVHTSGTFQRTAFNSAATMSDRIARTYVASALSVLCALPYLLGIQEQRLNVWSLVFTSGEGDPAKQAALLVLYCVGVLLLIVQVPPRWLLFVGAPLLILLAWSLVSIIWSVNPDGSARRLVALFGTVALGAFAGIRFDVAEFIRLLTKVAAIVIVASFVVAVVQPEFGLDPEGRLRGVFFHKNYLASFAAIAMFTIFLRLTVKMDRNATTKVLLGLLFILCFFSLALSRSAGPLPALFVALMTVGVVQASRVSNGMFRSLVPMAISLGVVCAGALVIFVGGSMFERGADLSGRTEVWKFAALMIEQRPWLGYGYGVFWLGENAPGAAFWRSSLNFVPHAHNGYLQLALDTGAIGLGCLAAALISFAIKVGLLLRHRQNARLLWAVGFIAFFCVINLGEADAWLGNDLHTILFVYVMVRTNVEYARYTGLAFNLRKSKVALRTPGSGSFA